MKRLGFIFLFVCCPLEPSRAVWSPPLNVTVSGTITGGPLRLVTDGSNRMWCIWGRTFIPMFGDAVNYVSASYWTGSNWSAPQDLAFDAEEPSVSLDSLGYPWVVYRGYDNSNWWIGSRRWNGVSWNAQANVVAPSGNVVGYPGHWVDASDRSWVAFLDASTLTIRVKMWTGAAWAFQGGDVNTVTPPFEAWDPQVVVDSLGVPRVFFDCGPSGTDRDICVSTWNGSGWDPEVKINNPDSLQDNLGQAGRDASGRPVVFWTSYNAGGSSEILWSSWDGSAWSPESAVSDPDTVADEFPAMDLGPTGRIAAAWSCADASNEKDICVKVWDGSAWEAEQVVDAGSLRDDTPAISFDGANAPWVVLDRTISGFDRVYWSRWSPDPTPTVSPTISLTATRSLTYTLSPTESASPTESLTPTVSATPTVTKTWSRTRSHTSTITTTGTYTRTHSATFTLTPTRSLTYTISATLTWSETLTESDTFTVSDTLTETPTSTETLTASPTPTNSPTVSATPTDSPTRTPSGTGTATVTPSITPGAPGIESPAVAPNPVVGDDSRVYFRLPSPLEQVRVRVYTGSGRFIRESVMKPSGWGGFVSLPLPVRDENRVPLANGLYHYVIEAVIGNQVVARKAGTFFVLR